MEPKLLKLPDDTYSNFMDKNNQDKLKFLLDTERGRKILKFYLEENFSSLTSYYDVYQFFSTIAGMGSIDEESRKSAKSFYDDFIRLSAQNPIRVSAKTIERVKNDVEGNGNFKEAFEELQKDILRELEKDERRVLPTIVHELQQANTPVKRKCSYL